MTEDGKPRRSGGHDGVSEVFDTYAEDYSETIDRSLGRFGTRHDSFTRHKAALIGDLLRARGLSREAIDLLDIGCGTAALHRHVAGSFRSIRGIDLSADSIEIARQTCPENSYDTYGGGPLPYASESVDMTLAVCVFHHVPPADWLDLAAEMLRVLRPGGLALVIEHNPWNPVTRHIVNTCPIDRDAVLLRMGQLAALFRATGGVGITTRSILSVPAFSDGMRRLDALLGYLPFGAQYYCIARKPGLLDDPAS